MNSVKELKASMEQAILSLCYLWNSKGKLQSRKLACQSVVELIEKMGSGLSKEESIELARFINKEIARVYSIWGDVNVEKQSENK